MSKSRAAIDTITGYYYQFDYYIRTLLEQQNDTATVCIEGIEDVDLETANETTAIQCKYYAKTEYNHSVIAKPIRLMLKHYSENSNKGLQYRIYGFYSSGQGKLPDKIDIDFAKEHFFTYIENKVKHEEHKELNLTDDQLDTFLSHLHIDINAVAFSEQEKSISEKLQNLFNCKDFEAEHFYYNNALRLVKDLSIKQNEVERTISKADFLAKINTKEPLYNLWFLKKNGIKIYCNSVKTQYFSPSNVSPFERVFLIECDTQITEPELKTLLLKLSKNWSNISPRQSTPYCPYVYLNNISDIKLLNLKKALQNDEFVFVDGYDFKNADFSLQSICRKPNFYNNIKLKIINEKDQIDAILDKLTRTREIYQFYISEIFYVNGVHSHQKIPIAETNNIIDII